MKRFSTLLTLLTLIFGLAYPQSNHTGDTEIQASSILPDINVSIFDDGHHNTYETIEPELSIIIDKDGILQNDEVNVNMSSAKFNFKDTKEWRKYKTLRAIGWSFLGVGLPSFLVGPCLMAAGSFDGNSAALGSGYALFLAGIAMTISSVPILICAYHNRNKAKRMNIDLGVSSIDTNLPFSKVLTTPSLAVTLNF